MNIKTKMEINSYQGIRHKKGLPVRGQRTYVKAEELPRVLNGLGIAIVSTSNGLMTDKEARKASLGGEVLAYIW